MFDEYLNALPKDFLPILGGGSVVLLLIYIAAMLAIKVCATKETCEVIQFIAAYIYGLVYCAALTSFLLIMTPGIYYHVAVVTLAVIMAVCCVHCMRIHIHTLRLLQSSYRVAQPMTSYQTYSGS